jgi:hypothetical protein
MYASIDAAKYLKYLKMNVNRQKKPQFLTGEFETAESFYLSVSL